MRIRSLYVPIVIALSLLQTGCSVIVAILLGGLLLNDSEVTPFEKSPVNLVGTAAEENPENLYSIFPVKKP